MRLAAVLLIALLAAGCATPAAVPADELNASADDGTSSGASGGPVPTEGGDAALGHMPHMHDYWAGRERVTLFDDTVDPTQNADPFMAFYGVTGARVGGHFWRLPDEAIVMEGTGQMDITATWDDPLTTSVGLVHRPSPGAEWSEPLPLENGELASIAVTPAMTDMPHMTTSRWEFAFFAADAPGALLGPFDLRVEIVKVRDIMLFPGHPLLFEGQPQKVLHDREHEHTETSYVLRAPNAVTQGGFGEKTVAPDKLVPMETRAMRVEVTVLDASSTPGEVAEIRFFYRGADTSYLGHPTVLPLEGSLDEKFLAYQFPVEMEQTDSPYADASQWIFFVEPAVKFVGAEQEPTMGGMTEVSIRYHLKVVAYDHELAEYSAMEGEE